MALPKYPKLLTIETELGRAFSSLVEQLSSDFSEDNNHIRLYLVGGMAMHLYIGDCRTTSDVDLFSDARVVLRNGLFAEYRTHSGEDAVLYVDACYSPSLGLLHPDYAEDAVPLRLLSNRPFVYALHPVDLALTKISRFGETDRNDIALLSQHGLMSPEDLKTRAEEAMDYYVGNMRWLRLNLNDAVDIVAENMPYYDGR